MAIQLYYAVPCSELSDYVTLFYDFFADVPVFDDVERADHAQFRFVLSPGIGSYRYADGTTQVAPTAHVSGPTSGATRIHVEGPVALFGMGLSAAGWAALVGNDASTMLNRVIGANTLFGTARVEAAMGALRSAPDLAARVRVGEALVRDLIGRADGGTTGFVRQVDAWLVSTTSPEMPALIAATGLSRRQIERKCNALYGAPPKLLARKYRALRAAVAIGAGAETPGDAVERGFYDQSHMIREIKQFVGLTPGQIRAKPTILSQLTMFQRRDLGDKVGPLVSGT